jgi:hypothetical protein
VGEGLTMLKSWGSSTRTEKKQMHFVVKKKIQNFGRVNKQLLFYGIMTKSTQKGYIELMQFNYTHVFTRFCTLAIPKKCYLFPYKHTWHNVLLEGQTAILLLGLLQLVITISSRQCVPPILSHISYYLPLPHIIIKIFPVSDKSTIFFPLRSNQYFIMWKQHQNDKFTEKIG